MASRKCRIHMIALAIVMIVLAGACRPGAPATSIQSETPAAVPAGSSARAIGGQATSAVPTVATLSSPTAARTALAPEQAAAPILVENTPVPTVIRALTPDHAPCSQRALAPAQLPAPLYVLDGSEIGRLEPDGQTCTHVTNGGLLHVPGTALFDVSPRDGALVYRVGGAGCATCLIQADALGQHPQILLNTTSFIDSLRWSPDGSHIALQVVRGEQGDLDTGLYIIQNGGGMLQRVLSSAYTPRLWSPDGSRLLLQAATSDGNMSFALYNLASGQIITPSLPVARSNYLGESDFFAWSADSIRLYQVLDHSGPEIWELDSTSGVLTPFLAGNSGDGAQQLATGLSAAADGWVYAFLAGKAQLQAEELPEYALYRVSADGSKRERLRPETFPIGYQGVFWAPDHSGALVLISETDVNTGKWFWVPTNGQPLVEFDTAAAALRWGALPAGAAPATTPAALATAVPAALAPTATSALSRSVVRLNTPLVPGTHVMNFQLSRDGHYAVYVVRPTGPEGGDAVLYSAPLSGGPAHRLGDLRWSIPGGYRYDITSDSQYVIYHTEYGIYSVPIDGGATRKLAVADDYQVSLDGRFVVVETSGSELGRNLLLSIPPDGSAPITLSESLDAGGEAGPQQSSSSTAVPAWDSDYQLTPDGGSVIYRTSDALFSVPIDGGAPVRLSAAPEPDTYIYGYTIILGGSRVLYDTRQFIPWECPHTPSQGAGWIKISGIYSVRPDGSDLIKLASAPSDKGGIMHGYGLSPDSAQLFFSTYTTIDCGTYSDQQLDYRVLTSGGTPTKGVPMPARLLDDSARDPRIFTQDGALYAQPDAGQAVIKLHNPAAMGDLAADSFPIYDDEEEYRNFNRQEDSYQISPGDRWVVYRAHEGDLVATKLYSVPFQGGEPRQLNSPIGLGGAIEGVRISPDGQHVIYKAAQPPSFTFELYSVPLQGGVPVRLSQPWGSGGGVGDAQVTADSRRVVYMAAQAQPPVFELYVTDIE
jgi:hypothetical protein